MVIAGKEYGSGSSRDWAAKGTQLLGVKAVIAESFERIHRSNLVNMGVLPLEFKAGENAASLKLTGTEEFSLLGVADGLKPRGDVRVVATDEHGKSREFTVTARIDTPEELVAFRHGGILPYVVRQLVAGADPSQFPTSNLTPMDRSWALVFEVLTSHDQAQGCELGFDLCGIAPAESFPELSFLRDWIERGYAGEMAWMPRSADRRADVREVVPGARSVIVTGTLYNTVGRPALRCRRLQTHVCGISRYAWGDDYHDVLKERLDALLAWMRAESPEPFDARAYVDTGPVQERVYAQYAGLGWIGKNTCLINPELGSWLFLSEIICTLPLEPDTQGLEQCGSCTRCLEACPTGALVDSGVLDSTRCLSYLTIELRGAIPDEYRPALGTHVYGCDICQDVCPYNQVPPQSDDAAWQPRPGLRPAAPGRAVADAGRRPPRAHEGRPDDAREAHRPAAQSRRRDRQQRRRRCARGA